MLEQICDDYTQLNLLVESKDIMKPWELLEVRVERGKEWDLCLLLFFFLLH